MVSGWANIKAIKAGSGPQLSVGQFFVHLNAATKWGKWHAIVIKGTVDEHVCRDFGADCSGTKHVEH